MVISVELVVDGAAVNFLLGLVDGRVHVDLQVVELLFQLTHVRRRVKPLRVVVLVLDVDRYQIIIISFLL